MKIKFFIKGNKFKKQDFVFNPNFYWKYAILVTLLFIIGTVFFGYRLFVEINQDPSPVISLDDGQTPKVNKIRLEKDLNYFSSKAQKSMEIINSPSPVVDPSL